MSGTWRSLALTALALLLTPRLVRADDGTRLFVGTAFSMASGTLVTVAGETASDEGEMDLALELGGSTSVLSRHFALLGFARLGTWLTDWSSERDEGRGRFDLAVGPELRVPFHRVTFRLAAPVGYSIAWINEAPGRAVREEYSGGHGLTFGCIGGMDMWGEHHGGYMALSYVGHVNWFERHSELIAAPQERATESYQFATHAFVISGGYAYRFK